MYIGNRINLFAGIGLVVFGFVVVISGNVWGFVISLAGIAAISSAMISHACQKRVRIKKEL